MLTLHLKKPENIEQIKPTANRKEEIIIREEINEIGILKITWKNETNNSFFENINKIDKY